MKTFIHAALVLALLAGIAILLYPTVSDGYNRYEAARRISEYGKAARAMEPAEIRTMVNEARVYNQRFEDMDVKDAFSEPSGPGTEEYLNLLDPNGDGIMCSIEIPAIGVRLPVSYLMSLRTPASLFAIGLATPASSAVQILLCGIWFWVVTRREKQGRLPGGALPGA